MTVEGYKKKHHVFLVCLFVLFFAGKGDLPSKKCIRTLNVFITLEESEKLRVSSVLHTPI